MVIEDDPFQRRVAVNLLRDLGIGAVLEAANGREALALCAEGEIDIALVDLKMPEVDGMQFLRLAARDKRIAAVVIVTSFDHSVQVAAESMARSLGVTVLGVVGKPLTAQRVKNLLVRYLQEPRSTERASAWRPDADALRGALDANALTVHYQPEVEMASLHLVAVEALVRWDHPDGGMLLPGSFLDLAEETGLMRRLTEFVLDRALSDLSRLRRGGVATRLAVNLSASTLDKPGAAEALNRRVVQSDTNASDVCIEITEHSAGSDNIFVVENLLQLRLNGFSLALDDYGTGSATMQQLNRLPLTQLKIDRSFVAESAHRVKLRALLESSVELARRLGLQSVAEGVERDADWELLRELRCDVAQGHLIAQAMPAEAVPDWHHTWSRSR